MRIVYVCHHRKEPMGGAARTSAMLAEAMQKRGHDVTLFFSDDFLAYPRSERLRQILLPIVLRTKRACIRQLEPDVLDISGGYGYWLFRSLKRETIWRVARTYGLEEAEWIETLQDSAQGRLRLRFRARLFRGWWQIRQVRRSCAEADMFVGPTAESVHTMTRRFPLLRGSNTGLGIEQELFEHDAPGADGTFRILFIGAWTTRKAYQDFVEASKRMMEVDKSVELRILGTDLSESDVQSSYPTSLHDRIVVYQRLSRDEQLKVMRSCSVSVCTSVYEGFSLANLEALAVGLPLISTAIGFLSEAHPHYLATIIPKRNPEALLDALLEIRRAPQDPKLAERRRDWARERTWDEVAAKTEAAYDERLVHRLNRK